MDADRYDCPVGNAGLHPDLIATSDAWLAGGPCPVSGVICRTYGVSTCLRPLPSEPRHVLARQPTTHPGEGRQQTRVRGGDRACRAPHPQRPVPWLSPVSLPSTPAA